MKKKVGTLIEEDVIKLAKRRAAEEGRPLSDLIQQAIVAYLGKTVPEPAKREAAYNLFCDQPIRIPKVGFDQILREDAWGI